MAATKTAKKGARTVTRARVNRITGDKVHRVMYYPEGSKRRLVWMNESNEVIPQELTVLV